MVILALINLVQIEKVATFLLMLSILVVLHEYGHFILARRNGVRVNEFAVGFGPKLWSWTSPRSGTKYALNLLPIGGYCAMQGEDGKTTEAEQRREFLEQSTANADDNFQAKSTGARLAIVVAGPAMNFALAFVILLFSALVFGVVSTQDQPVIGPLTAGFPAQKAGLQTGDRITAINGQVVKGGDVLVNLIHGSLGKPIALAYTRNGVGKTIKLTPVKCPPPQTKFGCIGFNPIPAYHRVNPIEAIVDSGNSFAAAAQTVVGGLVLIVSHPKVYASQISGPIGMGQAAGVVQDFGWAAYLNFAAVISFALGLFNLLPLPALDGGRGVFIVAEMLRGKPVDPEKEALVHVAGFALLMVLMLFVAFHDVARIVSGKGVF
ncbi:MAG: M50 family metallopeptidase [Candidatus Eremiobacteraeota bacterium]|nr:M50 family metallopeptidase [Candidatus Eremiobacteraeota bacterium]